MMYTILCYFWIIVSLLIYLLLGFISSFSSLHVNYPLVLFHVFGCTMMVRNKWWGVIPGCLVGISMIVQGHFETGQIIKEYYFGVVIFIYYLVMGGYIYLQRNRTKQSI